MHEHMNSLLSIASLAYMLAPFVGAAIGALLGNIGLAIVLRQKDEA